MTTKSTPNTKANEEQPSPDGVAPRKTYQRPTVRVLGAVHLMTHGGGGSRTDAGGTMTLMSSDRALKHDIIRIGDHPIGIGLYLFTYKPEYRAAAGSGRQFGVMADEVERVMPAAVSVHPNGYKMVDYARLGITRAEP
jgi:hypothetical protein